MSLLSILFHLVSPKRRGTKQQPNPSDALTRTECTWAITYQRNSIATSLVQIQMRNSLLEQNNLARTSADPAPTQNLKDQSS